MSKVLTVIRKEYIERVHSKAFLIGTLLGPLFMGALVIGPSLLADATGDQARTVAVVDRTGRVVGPLETALAEREDSYVTLTELDCASGEAACLEDLKAMVLAEEADAGLVIPADFFANPEATFYNTAVGAVVLRDDALGPALNQVLQDERFRRENLDPALRAKLFARTGWNTLKLTADAESAQNAEVGIIGGFMMVMIIYIMVLVYGQQNLTVVIEEKTSRMVEVLLASLRPEQLMLGKVLGIGLAALTQVAVWTVAGAAVSAQGLVVAGAEISLSLFGPWFWLNFFVFFLLGYFLYASLYAGIGAMCNSVQDSQQFSVVLTMGMVVPILLMTVVIKAPDQPLATILSLVPFFSPILMFMRISVSNPPLWQVVTSWVLLAGTIWLANKVAGQLFRAGILLYGATPTWGSLAKALRG